MMLSTVFLTFNLIFSTIFSLNFSRFKSLYTSCRGGEFACENVLPLNQIVYWLDRHKMTVPKLLVPDIDRDRRPAV